MKAHRLRFLCLAALLLAATLAVAAAESTAPATTSAPAGGEPVPRVRQLADWLRSHHIGPELVVVIIAMLPIFELRGSLPVAILYFHMPWWQAYALSVVGNMIPIIPIVLLIGPVSDFLMRRSKFWHRFFTWMFERSRRRGADLVEKYEAIGLGIFVAIPLPVTGAWTGSMLAFLMRIRARRAFPCILGGVLTAGVVVTLVTYFCRETFRIFLNI